MLILGRDSHDILIFQHLIQIVFLVITFITYKKTQNLNVDSLLFGIHKMCYLFNKILSFEIITLVRCFCKYFWNNTKFDAHKFDHI
jgi:hypothetical protein